MNPTAPAPSSRPSTPSPRGSGATGHRTSRAELLRMALEKRLTAGASRGRRDALSIGRAAVAASLAYLVSHVLWGHEFPFFSSIVAFIIIGFGTETKIRKVIEMSAGVMIGVLLGELARSTIGSGTWQIAVVILGAGTLARLLDSGNLFGFQVTIQSLLVMIMPITPGMTPGGRVVDALTGVTVAILIHLLTSGDPRRVQRKAATRFFRELEDTMVSLALAARSGDVSVAQAALKSVRDSSQSFTDEWKLANEAANEMATYSPTAHRHAAGVERLQHLLIGSDRAMRNLRVIARREVEFLTAVESDAHSTLADALLACRDAITELRTAVGHDDVDFTAARRALRLFGSYLTPELLLKNDQGVRPGRAGHFEGVTLVIQLRSLAIDLLQATGLDAKDAKRFLPSLLIAADGESIGPRPLTREMKAVEPPATTEALELLITDRSDPARRR